MSVTDQTADTSNTPLPPQLIHQYTKDLSFEVPHGAAIFMALRSAPQVNINIDVQANQIKPAEAENGKPLFEVILSIKADATEALPEGETKKPRTVFITELAYAGVVTLNGGEIGQEALEAFLLVEVPRFLFPYARAIISDATREGGFPPVVLHPVDFMALYQSKRAQNFPEPAGEA
ncbi:protein-export chaperone SecB [Acetobacteraceae bacterium]|nr:protein-export chaperone SecB [Acetobacteraceae bacterium]